MAKWEYCKVIQGMSVQEEKSSPAGIKFLGVSEKETKSEKLDGKEVDYRLAQLGLEGWELVSHTYMWSVGETSLGSGLVKEMPVGELFLLKREIKE